MADADSILARLMAVIEDRRAHPSERSYTAALLAGGVDKIGGKICEEAAEVVEAARMAETSEGRAHLIHEAADLIYHLFVMLGFRQIALAEVEAELARRFGISGLDEKAARPKAVPQNPSPPQGERTGAVSQNPSPLQGERPGEGSSAAHEATLPWPLPGSSKKSKHGTGDAET